MPDRRRPCAVDAKNSRVPDTKENEQKCACPMCPTFTECMKNKGERLYCAKGSTRCALKRLGCVCGECEVAIEFGLASNYYCDGGPAKF